MGLGPTELAVIFGGLVMLVLGVGFPVWAAIDASRQPDAGWAAAGQNKTLWIVLPLVGMAACGVFGPIIAAVYVFGIRPGVLRGRDAALSAPIA